MAPKISVIIPAWNEQKHIEDTLKSILANDYPRKDYEIIVADSSSTDKTVSISKKYADKVVIGPKKGAGFARNLGAKHAKGEVFAFIDADTSAEPTWLSAIDHTLIKQGFGAATGKIRPKESNISFRFKMIYFVADLSCRITFKTKHPGMVGFNFITQRKYFEKAGGFPVDMVIEDWELARRLYRVGAKFKYNKMISVKTSSRRFQAEGFFRYLYNHLVKYVLFGKTTNADEYWKKKID